MFTENTNAVWVFTENTNAVFTENTNAVYVSDGRKNQEHKKHKCCVYRKFRCCIYEKIQMLFMSVGMAKIWNIKNTQVLCTAATGTAPWSSNTVHLHPSFIAREEPLFRIFLIPDFCPHCWCLHSAPTYTADVDKCSSFTRIESARAVAIWCGCLCSRQSGQRTVSESVIFWLGLLVLWVYFLYLILCGEGVEERWLLWWDFLYFLFCKHQHKGLVCV